VEEKAQTESRGRLKFRLEYDFTLQELRVTVSSNFLILKNVANIFKKNALASKL
jgi:hypothetical protein